MIIFAKRKWWLRKQNTTGWTPKHLFCLSRGIEMLYLAILCKKKLHKTQQDLDISCSWGFIRVKKRCLGLYVWVTGNKAVNRIYGLTVLHWWIAELARGGGKELRALFSQIVHDLIIRHLGESIGIRGQNFG